MFLQNTPFSKALAATNSQRPHWHESTSCIHLRATIPPKQTFFPLSFLLKSKQAKAALMAKIGNTTSYELQQGAGEASDWQDRESEKLETPWKQASCWNFCHKGGMGVFS